jgi:hypothetical protein
MGEAVLLHVARMAHFANGMVPNVTVFDRDAEIRELAFRHRFPGIDQACRLQKFQPGEADDPRVQNALARLLNASDEATAAVFCTDNDYANLSYALQLAPRLASPDSRLFVRMAETDGFAELLRERESTSALAERVDGFAMVSQTCTKASIVRTDLDELAIRIHEHFRGTRDAAASDAGKDASWREWVSLDESYRASSREAADHMAVQLKTFGLTPAQFAAFDEKDARFGHMLEVMGRMEHTRWCAERALAGWQCGKATDRSRRTTAELVEWDRLSEAARLRVREQIREMRDLLRGRSVMPGMEIPHPDTPTATGSRQ